MSRKRFERWNDHSCKVKDNQEGTFLSWEDVVYKLNKQQDIIGEQKIAIDELVTDYKKLEKENEQLKQRNNRQYEQLGRLYYLIEQKKWRALTDIIDDFKKSNEQLQKEWGTYGDVE